jgi:hypothetical protein
MKPYFDPYIVQARGRMGIVDILLWTYPSTQNMVELTY